VPSPRKPRPGAAQPNRKCERVWTLPPFEFLLESWAGEPLWGSSSTTEGAGAPAGLETAIERAHLTLRLRCRYIDYGSSSSSDYGGVGRAGLNYVL
jgi:hypothetical protein